MYLNNYSTIKLNDLVQIERKNIKPQKYSNLKFEHYSLPAFDNDRKPEISFGEEIKSVKYIVPCEAILFSKLNLRFKRVWKVKNIKLEETKVCSSEFFPVVIKDKEKVNIDYLYYILISDNFISDLQKSSSGTSGSHQRISVDYFLNKEIRLPSIEIQNEISKILLSIDKKIEINNKINRKLEEMAQAIFKQWFVDFEFPNEYGKPYKSSGGEMVESELGIIPKGWEVKTIGDLANVVSKGTTPRKSDIDNALDENSIKFIKVKDISDDGIIDLTNIEYIPKSVHINQLKRSILAYKDILLSIAGTIGRVSYVDEEVKNSNINQAVAFIRLTDINMYFLLVFYKFKSNDFQNSIQSKVVQGVQANISLTVIKNEKIIIPDNGMVDRYNRIVNSIFNKKDIVNKENNRLKSIRDELLPKLMSGEIRVTLDK